MARSEGKGTPESHWPAHQSKGRIPYKFSKEDAGVIFLLLPCPALPLLQGDLRLVFQFPVIKAELLSQVSFLLPFPWLCD